MATAEKQPIGFPISPSRFKQMYLNEQQIDSNIFDNETENENEYLSNNGKKYEPGIFSNEKNNNQVTGDDSKTLSLTPTPQPITSNLETGEPEINQFSQNDLELELLDAAIQDEIQLKSAIEQALEIKIEDNATPDSIAPSVMPQTTDIAISKSGSNDNTFNQSSPVLQVITTIESVVERSKVVEKKPSLKILNVSDLTDSNYHKNALGKELTSNTNSNVSESLEETENQSKVKPANLDNIEQANNEIFSKENDKKSQSENFDVTVEDNLDSTTSNYEATMSRSKQDEKVNGQSKADNLFEVEKNSREFSHDEKSIENNSSNLSKENVEAILLVNSNLAPESKSLNKASVENKIPEKNLNLKEGLKGSGMDSNQDDLSAHKNAKHFDKDNAAYLPKDITSSFRNPMDVFNPVPIDGFSYNKNNDALETDHNYSENPIIYDNYGVKDKNVGGARARSKVYDTQLRVYKGKIFVVPG